MVRQALGGIMLKRKKPKKLEMNLNVIVIVGNPIEGFSFHGPFEDYAQANEYASEYFPNHTTVTTSLYKVRW
jgi:hypothetical protein